MFKLLFGLFFLSGFSALAYQTAWQRMLGAFAGSDSVATTIIVSAFLFGLGIGSLIGALLADRLSLCGALRTFGICEVGVGAFACFSRTVFYDFFLGQLASVAGNPLISWLVVMLALLPPTALMGMSLPLLSRVVVGTIDRASARIGWLYGLNTLGAASGALLTGWVLIGTFGFVVTVYAAAALNFLIGGSALLYSERLSRMRPRSTSRAPARSGDGTRSRLLLWSAMVFASGFLAISLEIVWFRVFGTLLSSDAYAFSLTLAIFLLGDGLGIVAGAEVVHALTHPRRVFQLLQGVVGICALLSLVALFAVNGGTQLPLGVEGSRPAITAIMLAIVLPPAFVLGMSFPIIQHAIQDDPDLVGRRVGLVQLCNILGNTAGAVVTGLVLLHWLGTALTLRLIGIVSLVFVLFALADGTWIGSAGSKRTVRRRLDIALVLVLLALVALFPSAGQFWSALHRTSLLEGAIVLEDRSGLSVLRPDGGSAGSRLFAAGHGQSRVPFLPVHGALGVLGAILHPNPQDVLIIGQGTGGTPIAAGMNPKTRLVHVVDIVAPVFGVMQEVAVGSGQDALHKPVRAYYSDPRYTRTVADARHVLLTEDTQYDIIEADAIHPRIVLAGQFYSVDFFQLAMSRLKPSGYVVQWVPTPRTLASFLRVFPYVVRVNFALIGSTSPIDFSRERLAAGLAGSAGDYIERMGWDRNDVAKLLLSGPEQSWNPRDARDDRDVNTDLFPKDEYYWNRLKVDFAIPSFGNY
jgi:spermidine synthase